MRKLFIFAAAAALIVGCDRQTSKKDQIPKAVHVADIPSWGVSVVTVGDFRYVVVNQGHGVAICPETRK